MLGRHPTLWIVVINAAIMFAASWGLDILDKTQAAALVVVVNAAAGALNAWAVRPLPVPVFTYLMSSVVALVGLYGFDFTSDQTSGLNAVITAVLGLLTYGNVSPVDTAISKSTQAQAAPEVQTVPEA